MHQLQHLHGVDQTKLSLSTSPMLDLRLLGPHGHTSGENKKQRAVPCIKWGSGQPKKTFQFVAKPMSPVLLPLPHLYLLSSSEGWRIYVRGITDENISRQELLLPGQSKQHCRMPSTEDSVPPKRKSLHSASPMPLIHCTPHQGWTVGVRRQLYLFL